MSLRTRNNFNERRAILCEGPSDEAFFRELIKKHTLPSFSIRHTGDADHNERGGIDKFGQLLLGMPTWQGFSDLRDIIIVADNDFVPDENFKKVQRQLSAAHHGILEEKYAVPDKPYLRAKGRPSVAIVMIPGADKVGKLETLCLKAAQDASPAISKCVDDFAICTKTNGWPAPTLDEMKLRTLLTARHKKNPSVGLGKTWGEDPNLIPLDNACFTEIVTFLKSYEK